MEKGKVVVMDPDKCDDFRADTVRADDCAGQRMKLIQHLSLAWHNECVEKLVRYNEEERDGVVYNGWAMWRSC